MHKPFSPKDVARVTGCSVVSVRRAIAAGDLEARRINARVFLIDQAAVVDWSRKTLERAVRVRSPTAPTPPSKP